MKKLLGIAVLGLLWCNTAFTEELIKIPVYVHIVETSERVKFKNKYYDYNTITTTQMIEKEFSEANEIWKQANIYWDIIKIDKTLINIKNLKKYLKFFTNIRQLNDANGKKAERIWPKVVNSKDNNKKNAINVYYLPYMLLPSCGFTTTSKKKIEDYYVIIASTISPWIVEDHPGASCPSGWIVAHELGHILNLGHIGTAGIDLMMYHDEEGKLGNRIPPKQINKVRKFYKNNLKKKFE